MSATGHMNQANNNHLIHGRRAAGRRKQSTASAK
jgi:hypothetical protein